MAASQINGRKIAYQALVAPRNHAPAENGVPSITTHVVPKGLSLVSQWAGTWEPLSLFLAALGHSPIDAVAC